MKPSSALTKGLCLFLSAILLTQIALADTAQSNFWAERRKNLKQSRGGAESDQLLLASLPTSLFNPSQVFRELPSPKASQISSRALPSNLSLPTEATYNSLMGSLSSAYGNVRETFVPKDGKSGKTVILIQDVHMNQEAQENIGKAVQELIDQGTVGLIGLEGATKPIDLNSLRTFPYPDITKKVADYLLKENKITGPIHAGLTWIPSPNAGEVAKPAGDSPDVWRGRGEGKIPFFVGVDDPIHYKANVEAYKQSAGRQTAYKAEVGRLEVQLTKEKKAVFNPSLLEFDDQVEAFRKGTIKLGDYLKFISKQVPDTSLTIETFLGALEMEEHLNFSQVEKERSQVLEKLVQKLNPSTGSGRGKERVLDLVRESLAYRLGKVSHSNFYTYLRDLCKKSGVNLGQYPAMDSYIRYVLLSDSFKADQLFKDVTNMERQGYVALAKTSKEKDLAAQSKELYLTGKLVDFALTTNEWEEYKQIKQGAEKIRFPLPNRGRGQGEGETFGLSSFESFYQEAETRNTAMIQNLLKAMEEHKASTAVLVAGGFHSQGIQDKLKELKVASLTFVPKITKVDTENGSKYLSIFTQEKTPLEKLFQGEKLFLTTQDTASIDASFVKTAMAVTAFQLFVDQSNGNAQQMAQEKPVFAGWLEKAAHVADVHWSISLPKEEVNEVVEIQSPGGPARASMTLELKQGEDGDLGIARINDPTIVPASISGGVLARLRQVVSWIGAKLTNAASSISSPIQSIILGATDVFVGLANLFSNDARMIPIDINIANAGLDAAPHDLVNLILKWAVFTIRDDAEKRGMKIAEKKVTEERGRTIYMIGDASTKNMYELARQVFNVNASEELLAKVKAQGVQAIMSDIEALKKQHGHAGISGNHVFVVAGAANDGQNLDDLVLHEVIELQLWDEQGIKLIETENAGRTQSPPSRSEISRILREWMQKNPRAAVKLALKLHKEAGRQIESIMQADKQVKDKFANVMRLIGKTMGINSDLIETVVQNTNFKTIESVMQSGTKAQSGLQEITLAISGDLRGPWSTENFFDAMAAEGGHATHHTLGKLGQGIDSSVAESFDSIFRLILKQRLGKLDEGSIHERAMEAFIGQKFIDFLHSRGRTLFEGLRKKDEVDEFINYLIDEVIKDGRFMNRPRFKSFVSNTCDTARGDFWNFNRFNNTPIHMLGEHIVFQLMGVDAESFLVNDEKAADFARNGGNKILQVARVFGAALNNPQVVNFRSEEGFVSSVKKLETQTGNKEISILGRIRGWVSGIFDRVDVSFRAWRINWDITHGGLWNIQKMAGKTAIDTEQKLKRDRKKRREQTEKDAEEAQRRVNEIAMKQTLSPRQFVPFASSKWMQDRMQEQEVWIKKFQARLRQERFGTGLVRFIRGVADRFAFFLGKQAGLKVLPFRPIITRLLRFGHGRMRGRPDFENLIAKLTRKALGEPEPPVVGGLMETIDARSHPWFHSNDDGFVIPKQIIVEIALQSMRTERSLKELNPNTPSGARLAVIARAKNNTTNIAAAVSLLEANNRLMSPGERAQLEKLKELRMTLVRKVAHWQEVEEQPQAEDDVSAGIAIASNGPGGLASIAFKDYLKSLSKAPTTLWGRIEAWMGNPTWKGGAHWWEAIFQLPMALTWFFGVGLLSLGPIGIAGFVGILLFQALVSSIVFSTAHPNRTLKQHLALFGLNLAFSGAALLPMTFLGVTALSLGLGLLASVGTHYGWNMLARYMGWDGLMASVAGDQSARWHLIEENDPGPDFELPIGKEVQSIDLKTLQPGTIIQYIMGEGGRKYIYTIRIQENGRLTVWNGGSQLKRPYGLTAPIDLIETRKFKPGEVGIANTFRMPGVLEKGQPAVMPYFFPEPSAPYIEHPDGTERYEHFMAPPIKIKVLSPHDLASEGEDASKPRSKIPSTLADKELQLLYRDRYGEKQLRKFITGNENGKVTAQNAQEWLNNLTAVKVQYITPFEDAAGFKERPNEGKGFWIIRMKNSGTGESYTFLEALDAIDLKNARRSLSVRAGSLQSIGSIQDAEFFLLPKSVTDLLWTKIEQKIREAKLPDPLNEPHLVCAILKPFLESAEDKDIFERFLRSNPLVVTFIKHWVGKGVIVPIAGRYYLLPGFFTSAVSEAAYNSETNSMTKNYLRILKLDYFVHEFVHAIFEKLTSEQKVKIEKYFREAHPELAEIFDGDTGYKGQHDHYATEALANYLSMLLRLRPALCRNRVISVG